MSTPTPAPPKPSTPPATAPAKENLSPAESCSTSAAHTTYPATPNVSAPEACSTNTRSPDCSPCTPRPSRRGTAQDFSPRTRPTTRTSGCSNHPLPATPASSHDKEAPSTPENPPNPRPEVQYETHALSNAEPVRPIDWVTPARRQACTKIPPVYSPPWSVLNRFRFSSDYAEPCTMPRIIEMA